MQLNTFNKFDNLIKLYSHLKSGFYFYSHKIIIFRVLYST